VNTLLVSVINFTVWFAITFYVYLQTRSTREQSQEATLLPSSSIMV